MTAETNHLAVGSSIVALAGDWHSTATWAVDRIAGLGAEGIDTLFHLGDFGILPGPHGKKYLLAVESAALKAGVTVYVTPGNHEDWARLLSKQTQSRNSMGDIWWISDHIAVLPRGHRFTVHTPTGVTRTFVSLGGAPSINFETCTRGRDWWPEEMITPEDVARVVDDGHAEVMLAHDSPGAPYETAAVAGIRSHNPQGWSDLARSYANVGRNRIHAAYEAVQPRVFAHGHFHVAETRTVTFPDGKSGLVISTSQERTSGNLVRLSLDTLTPTW